MEYVHYTLLNRSDDFYSVTPKTWFEQWAIYRKVNGLEEQEEKSAPNVFIDDVL